MATGREAGTLANIIRNQEARGTLPPELEWCARLEIKDAWLTLRQLDRKEVVELFDLLHNG